MHGNRIIFPRVPTSNGRDVNETSFGDSGEKMQAALTHSINGDHSAHRFLIRILFSYITLKRISENRMRNIGNHEEIVNKSKAEV